jgi:enoyl-CoA hydratase/carnithine racemase
MTMNTYINIKYLIFIFLLTFTASFRTPFAALGQSPEGCSTFMFPRIMGEEIARKVLGEGRF